MALIAGLKSKGEEAWLIGENESIRHRAGNTLAGDFDGLVASDHALYVVESKINSEVSRLLVCCLFVYSLQCCQTDYGRVSIGRVFGSFQDGCCLPAVRPRTACNGRSTCSQQAHRRRVCYRQGHARTQGSCPWQWLAAPDS